MSEETPFLELCKVFEDIAATTKRLEIQSILTAFFRKIIDEDPKSLSSVLFLSTGTIYPQHRGIELGIGDHALLSAVASATGFTVKTVKQMLDKTGDLGSIAMRSRVNQLFVVQQRLTIKDVLGSLREIASKSGKSSTREKQAGMLSLINKASCLEAKYLIRLFETKLKIGLALRTVLICLASAFITGEDKEANERVSIVKEAYNRQPDFETIVDIILKEGVDSLTDKCRISPGIPLQPMLAKPSNNLTKAFSRVENVDFVSEFKYDGERVQIHKGRNGTWVFSRNTEDISGKYPDIACLNLGDRDFIIDGEAVAFENGKILPFQVLSTRKKKNVDSTTVKVCVFAFDILYFDGEELLDRPLRERQQVLRDNFSEIDGVFKFASSLICKSVEDIDSHFAEAIQSSCEGVMIKSLESPYRPSLRTNSWVKVKSDYLDSLGDSMDLVVMGVYYGKGKRTGSYGRFLLGVYNDETGKYEACCRVGTGFSNEDLQRFYARLSCIITADTAEYCFNTALKPDHWVRPLCVWEIKAASLSLSPTYITGSGDDKGISLRFPRFIRERDDKSAEQATTSGQLRAMYKENKEEISSDDEFN